MKKLENYNNEDLLELYKEIVCEYHYSPRKSKTFPFSIDEVKEEILYRMNHSDCI